MTRELLDLADPPSAIFAVNNLTTIGVLAALRERGVKVPLGMSVVGFDDIPTAELLDPPLTVVQQPTYRVGARAADLLIRRLREPGATVKEVVLAATAHRAWLDRPTASRSMTGQLTPYEDYAEAPLEAPFLSMRDITKRFPGVVASRTCRSTSTSGRSTGSSARTAPASPRS